MFSNSREFLDSLVESGKEVTITFNPVDPDYIPVLRGYVVWFDDDTIGVKFVERDHKKEPPQLIREKIVLYFKSAIGSIDPGWKKV